TSPRRVPLSMRSSGVGVRAAAGLLAAGFAEEGASACPTATTTPRRAVIACIMVGSPRLCQSFSLPIDGKILFAFTLANNERWSVDRRGGTREGPGHSIQVAKLSPPPCWQ